MKTPARAVTSLLTLALAASPAPAWAQRSPQIAASHVDRDVLSLACAPMATTVPPHAVLRITGGQDTQVRQSFAQGDYVTINAGSNQGVTVGQEYVVRRLLAPKGVPMGPNAPGTTRTAGWIKVYGVEDDLALATITYNCDALEVGDYLEPLALPSPPKIEPPQGKPERVYAKVVLGDDRRGEFGSGDYIVIDRGTAHGVTRGAQFALYRWKKRAPENFLVEVGDGVVMDVQEHTARVRLTVTRDAIRVNDLAAMRRPEQAVAEERAPAAPSR